MGRLTEPGEHGWRQIHRDGSCRRVPAEYQFRKITGAARQVKYERGAGKAGALFAKLFGEEPTQQVQDELRRFKQIIETGEITTTEGQSSGERSAMVKLIKKGVPG